MAGAVLTSCWIFSSSVRRGTRSFTLSAMGRRVLQKGNELVEGFDGSHENGGAAASDCAEGKSVFAERTKMKRERVRGLWTLIFHL